eukprot:762927-Hanusia_phi.AAC.5
MLGKEHPACNTNSTRELLHVKAAGRVREEGSKSQAVAYATQESHQHCKGDIFPEENSTISAIERNAFLFERTVTVR